MGYNESTVVPTASKLYKSALFNDLAIDKSVDEREFNLIKAMIASGQSKFKDAWAKATWASIPDSAPSTKPQASRVALLNALIDEFKKDAKASTVAVEAIELALSLVRKDLDI